MLLTWWRPAAGPPPSETVTWNPSDKSAEFTLSGGNLVATHSAASSWDSLRATKGRSSKRYFEVTFTSGAAVSVGVGNASAALNNYIGFDNNGIGYLYSGLVYKNNASVATLPTYTTGDVVCVAYDGTNNRIWFRLNGTGNWNNSGTANPATNTGGLVTPTAPVFPMGSGYQANALTANFGASALVSDPPTGFYAWQVI